jgi:hypothetical protein
MTTFTVCLDKGSKWLLPLENFRQLFPECVWTSALDMSLDTLITCEHPAVSERILELLLRMCQDGCYGHPDAKISSDEYRAAHRYLNIPIFACMAEPKFAQVWRQETKFQEKLEDIFEYELWLIESIQEETLALMEYIWAKIPPTETLAIDRVYVKMAAVNGWIWLLEGLFRRGFTPMTECNSKFIVLIAADNNRDECVRWMLPKISPDDIPGVCCCVKPDMARILLTHPQLEATHLLRLVQRTHQSIIEPLTCDIIFHPKATRPLVEAFEFTTLVTEPLKVQQFLESKLSQPEDIPLLLERCHLLDWPSSIEVILKDSRVTHAMIRLMHARSARSRDLNQIHILYCDWLGNHGHIYPIIWPAN